MSRRKHMSGEFQQSTLDIHEKQFSEIFFDPSFLNSDDQYNTQRKKASLTSSYSSKRSINLPKDTKTNLTSNSLNSPIQIFFWGEKN